MFPRLLEAPTSSFFLFGPRGTGKSSFVSTTFPGAQVFDLLQSEIWLELHSEPGRLGRRIPQRFRGWVVIDEVQKAPALLDEVHRLIESRKLKFALTGSSARKLRRHGVNLLAGRALLRHMHPLTATEMGESFALKRALSVGMLPGAVNAPSSAAALDYLRAYVQAYLKEEVLQEGLSRNLAAFSRFLEAASFSQGSVLNVSAVARDCSVERKVVEDYFGILDDLLLAVRLEPFTRRAKRDTVTHKKFYLFDVGVFRALRRQGPLDSLEEIEGPAAETLVLQHLRAVNDSLQLGYSLHFWRTRTGAEVDFVLYGERGLWAVEVKRSPRVRDGDFDALRLFLSDYPEGKAMLVYGGSRRYWEGSVEVIPLGEFLTQLPSPL